ncbi:MAG TPA: hypothetical protein DGZ24_05520 [Rhodospirillaceae bacterium]|nr:hypothetical protein [Rhodospirillaceae bacterium]
MAEVDWREQTCPLCCSASHNLVSTRDRHGEKLSTVLCCDCGHVFTNPAPSSNALADYYRDIYRQDYKKVTIPKRKHIYRAGISALNRLTRLARHINTGVRIIDIGAGGGEFVYLLSKRNFDAIGIEPHTGYTNYAREEYKIDMRAGTLETIEFLTESTEAVTMHHVLEHTSSPMAALKQVWKWLKPGGVIAIEVPNLASWGHAPHHRFHRAHLHTFNRIGIEDALINSGFTLIDVSPQGERGHLSAIAKKLPAHPKKVWRNAAPDSHATLVAHTQLAHFLSGQRFRRLYANITRPVHEARAIHTLGNPKTGRLLLDALFTANS